MLRIRILHNVKVLLNRSLGIGQKRPLGAHRSAELLKSMVVIRGDRGNLRVCHSNLRIKRSQFEVLLVLLRAIMPARTRGSSPCSSLSLRGVPV